MTTKKWYGVEDLEKKLGILTLGQVIKAFRESDEYTQAAYARKLKISRAFLCDLEKGRRFPSPRRAAKLAKAMGLADEFLILLSIQDQLRSDGFNYKLELKSA